MGDVVKSDNQAVETVQRFVMPQAMGAIKELGAGAIMFYPEVFESVNRVADVMASARCMIPAHLIGKPADCFAVIIQALSWGMNPFAVAQKTHLVSGTLGYEAQLVHAVVEHSGAISGGFEYEYFGSWEKVIGKFKTCTGKTGNEYQKPDWTSEDEKGCGIKVSAVVSKTGNKQTLTLLLSQATVRNSTLWAGDPKQQLAYLAVKRWARLYTPGAILGVYTKDELESSTEYEQPVSRYRTPTETKSAAVEAEVDTGTTELPLEEVPETNPPADKSVNSGDDKSISYAQVKLLWAKVRERKLDEEKVKSGLRVLFGLESTKDIAAQDFNKILLWIENGCPDPEER